MIHEKYEQEKQHWKLHHFLNFTLFPQNAIDKVVRKVQLRVRWQIKFTVILSQYLHVVLRLSLREKCPNTEFFLVRIFLYSN